MSWGREGCYVASLDLVIFRGLWNAAAPDGLSFRNVSSRPYLGAFLLCAHKSSHRLSETPAPRGIPWQPCSHSRWPISLLQALLSSLFPRSRYSDTVVPFSSAISIVSILIGRWEILEGEQNVNLF